MAALRTGVFCHMIMICAYQETQTETYGFLLERIAFGCCAKFYQVGRGVYHEVILFYGACPTGNQKGPQEHHNHPFSFHVVVLLSGPVFASWLFSTPELPFTNGGELDHKESLL